MSFLNPMTHTKKLCGASMIFLCLLFIFPEETHAQYFDIVQSVKELVADPIVYILTNQIIKKLASQTVNWINSGFQGNPAYVTDPGQFFLNVADNTVSGFLSSTNLNQLCSPFRAQVRLALVKNYLSDNQNFSCTLSKIKNNYDQFTQDFSQGGWEGWFEMTQNNQNNPYGAYLDAQDQMAIQIGKQQTKYQNQLNWGRGILSYEKCPAGHELDPALGTGDCDVAKETVTPGSVIESQLNKTLGASTDRLVAADEVDEIVGALLNQLVGTVVGGIGNGLRGASQTTTGKQSFTGQLSTDPGGTSSNPNAGTGGGGGVTCTTSAPTTSCTNEPDIVNPDGSITPGGTNCTTDPGVQTCTTNPVNTPPVIINDGGGGGGPGIPPPADAADKHGNHQAEVQAAKDSMIADGYIFARTQKDENGKDIPAPDCQVDNPNTPADESRINNRLEVLKRAARLIGGDAGLLDKPGGSNCSGFASDIIIFKSDGYIYDVLTGANDAQWSPGGCGTDGTCADRWRAP